jgi:HEAT repeat protein
MLGALDDPVAAVRMTVVQSLQRVTRADVIDRLAQAEGDPSADVRGALCETLTTLETTQAATILARLAGDHEIAVSAKAVRGLMSLSDAEGLARVLALWPQLVPEARRRVKEAMGDVVVRLDTTIATALEPEAREIAVRLLAAVDATAHAERISRALEDPDGRVRLAAVQALVTLEPERVGEWLKRVANDPVAEVRAAARRGPWKLV